MMMLAQLEKIQTSSVWIYNRTNPKGIISFLSDSGAGSNDIVTIPITWIPMDLTTQSPKKSLVNNAHFRRLVSGGVLELISEEDVMKVFSSPDAQEERVRVFNLGATGHGIKDALPPEVKSEIDLEGVNGVIIGIANNKDLTFKDALAEIRRKTDTLSKQDYEYLSNNSIIPELKLWAKKSAAGG
jgi:hypothetical protein